MKETAFWGFFGFGILTVVFAFWGGFWALLQQSGAGSNVLGFLLLFLGVSLTLMLGSLLLIQRKERSSSKKGGKK